MVRRSDSALTVRRRIVSMLLMMLLLIGNSLIPAVSIAQSGGGSIQQTALNQIATLLAEKDARTPAEQKVDSNLLYAFKQQTGVAKSAIAATLRTNVAISAGKLTTVDITADVSDRLLKQVETLGGKVISSYPQYRSIRAELPINQVLTVASWDAVIFIQPQQEAITANETMKRPAGALRNATAPAFMAPRLQMPMSPASAVRPQAIQVAPLAATQGITTTNPINRSEGDITHRANLARQTYGYIGTGVKTCVLSNGVNALAALQASGDLPAVTVVPDQAGTGNEGGAMLEIVHDLAPGAQLFYATAFGGIASFAANIKTLRNTYGCDVIVDDVSYPSIETPFQLGQAPSVVSNTNGGIVTQAVNEVVADGAFYFSSAGNSGNLSDGTSGVWEGDFVSAGASVLPSSGNLLDFDPGAGVQGFNTITGGSASPVTLFWSDPLGGSQNDYDLFLLGANGASVLGSSTNPQTGSQDPREYIPGATNAGERIVVVQRPGAQSRYLHINTNRGALQIATAGQIGGHAAALQGYGVAATPAIFSGPYPGVFSGANIVETFSSDGPRRHFYTADGTAITAGNFSATGGAVAQKPDITAADNVSCLSPGPFNPFFGTSAAAPHAAAIATLLKSVKPTLTNAELRAILTNAPTAIDIEAAGVDRDSGAGIIDALTAMQTLNPAAVPLLSSQVTFREGPLRNNNGVIEAGETFAITVPLTNTTLAVATNVQLSAELLNPVPGVQVLTPGPLSYGTLAAGGAATNSTSPILVSVAPTVACGTKLDFKLTATYTGGGSNSPQVFFASLMLGTININTTLDATNPPSSAIAPVYTSSTGTQTGRLSRSGTASSCQTNNTDPGLNTATGARRYDAYTFTNTAATDQCMTVTLTTPLNGDSSALFAVAYGASGFVPGTPNTNYLADAGTNLDWGLSTTFSFLVPAGQPFTIVVHEVNPGAGVGAGRGAYTLTISGTGLGTCTTPPAQPATIAATAGSGQSAITGAEFAIQLQATVRDAGGNPLPGVGVAFSSPASGAGVTFPHGTLAVTNAAGQANLLARANGTLGSYSVTANTSNGALATGVTFALTNQAGAYLPFIVR